MNDEPKMNKNREKKQQIMASLVEKMQKAKAIVFTNYQGLTHKQLEGFKKQIKTMGSDFVVAKNSLILRSAKDANVKIANEKAIEGPTGTMFIYEDIVAPLKQLAKIIKELGLPSVKIGFFDNKELAAEQVLKLASLPSREVLLAQVVGSLKGPIFGLHRAMSWNIQKLAMTLRAIEAKKN
jgi:large subunit ribosomal protein L10